MLSENDLLNNDAFPDLNDVSLSLYKDFSKNILIDRRFLYVLEDGTKVNIRISEECIHHLLGIQHIDRSITPKALFDRIENGLSFQDFERNESIKRRFKDMKPRLRMFSCIYQTLRLGEYFYLPNRRVPNTQQVEMDYIVYREISGKGNNIGIRHEGDDWYAPLTLLVARARDPKEYIEDTSVKRVKSLTITDSSNKYIEQIVYGDHFMTKKL